MELQDFLDYIESFKIDYAEAKRNQEAYNESMNEEGYDDNQLIDLIKQVKGYAKKILGYKSGVGIELIKNAVNSSKGVKSKTGEYDPNGKVIKIYISDRHPKDILRSLCHELVHHAQNDEGELDSVKGVEPEEFRENPKLKELEEKAYKLGGTILKGFSFDQ
jgi:hypothetical protein